MVFKAADSLTEQIAGDLAGRIIRGQLKAGEWIRELHVVQTLNVSRGAVREALLILERQHLVTIQVNRGAQVSALSAEHVQGLFVLLLELYVLLGNAAAGWKTEADLEQYRAIQRELAVAAKFHDVGKFVTAGVELSKAGYRFANNPYLQEVLDNLTPVISRMHYLILDRRRDEMQLIHQLFRSLQDALEARDKKRMRDLLQRYCEHSCRQVLAALASQAGDSACG
ncbi:GntR family transcriptional regulator [Pseudomonas sp. N040]|uniref:GntR family transcriptional regulator n=1 Tax=Pseudomonas sp. N040 TaxID=2785325 RepID=UPI0018A25331|nr:GntR family transcriptional regulator [Pseudomonas sp. N040]MBF7730834.1 GntR family transcriptional regulator [Pseudomonas sp. N040]MBW7014477.1 GntR family transcriptional regulator [Pseudomonas sp. N040]